MWSNQALCLTNWEFVQLKKLSVLKKVPVPTLWGQTCSGHLNQLTRRIWPQRDTGKREESGPTTELLERVADTRLGFPKLGERIRASFRAGSFCSCSQGGDNLTHGGGAEQIRFGQSIREVMLRYDYTLDALLASPSPVNQSMGWGQFYHFKSKQLAASLYSMNRSITRAGTAMVVENSQCSRHCTS